MGEGLSKLETSPLVSMCKERKELIKAAKYCRYDIVSAFVRYLQSLLDVGNALNQYVEEELVLFDDSPQVSGSDCEPCEEDSHMKFTSSDFESDLDSLTDHVHSDMEVPRPPNTKNQDQSAAYMSTKWMENRYNEIPRVIPGQSWNLPSSHPPQSNQENTHIPGDVLHEDVVQHEYNQRFSLSNRWENSQSLRRYPQHVNQDLPGSSVDFSYYDDMFSHYCAEAISMDIPSNYSNFQNPGAKQNTPATALPTPPPPQVSTWDFSYLFNFNDDDYYENLHFNYSCDVREVRELEGIPDLEDEIEQSSTKTKFDEKGMKRGNLNSGNDTSNSTQLISHKDALSNEEKTLEDGGNVSKKEIKDNTEVFVSKNLETGIREGVSSDAEVTMVQGSEFLGTNSASTPVTSCRMGLKEAIQDIKDEFENLFNFGKEFSATIEEGKLPHHPISTNLRGFASFFLGLIIPSTCSRPPHMLLNQSASKGQLLSNADKTNNQGHVCPKFGDLSSTLEQLHVWERRLYGEVMGEEKLWILYDKKCKRLKDLDDRGAESDKINNVWVSVRRMKSEINVAVASICVISREIDELRDHKLLPELYKLIEGLIRLWKFMGTCHQKQFQAITEAKSHIHMLDPGIRKYSSSRATLRLERVILNWGICFSNFVNTQKAFVKYLNEWLLRCMLQEPEETADGIAPFSPRRIGAPPIFSLCNDWYHAIDAISEIGVTKAFDSCASGLHYLYEKQKEEQAQKARVDCLSRDYEHMLQSFHKKNSTSLPHNSSSINIAALESVIEAGVPVLDGFDEGLTTSRKRLLEQRARHEEVIRQVNDTASSCLQEGLSPIFEILENYCLENLKVYELLRLPYAVSPDQALHPKPI